MRTLIKKLLSKAGYTLSSNKYKLKPVLENKNIIRFEFDHLLGQYLVNLPDPSDFSFLQIGAFDGIECDPLRKYLLRFKWKGIMMEPQPQPYNRLKAEYANSPGLQIINAALARKDGETSMFVIEGNDLPEWTKGMASFSKDNILKHDYLVKNLESCIREIKIKTVSFESLFKKYIIDRLDLLQVDTEGFDAEILRMFPFHIIKPQIIHFESKHIKKKDLEDVLDMLIGLGYNVAEDREEDIMCILRHGEK